jgi:nucleoside-diphosphate-sugar epimerase
LRFPGIISADTIPVGGTSDYASLMAHNAAKAERYQCFVSAATTLSFIAMPDAIEALIQLASTEKAKLSQSVYNLHGFTISAQEIADYTKSAFPRAEISFSSIPEKQQIVDSWPAIFDCSAFCRDVGWKVQLGKKETFFQYLFPRISERYSYGS